MMDNKGLEGLALPVVEDREIAAFLAAEGGQIAHDMAHHLGDQLYDVMRRNGLAQRSEAGATAMLTIAATMLLEQAVDQCSKAAESDCRGAVALLFMEQLSPETRRALADSQAEWLSAQRLLRRALDLAENASTLDWNEDRNIMGAIHLAGDIRATQAVSHAPKL